MNKGSIHINTELGQTITLTNTSIEISDGFTVSVNAERKLEEESLIEDTVKNKKLSVIIPVDYKIIPSNYLKGVEVYENIIEKRIHVSKTSYKILQSLENDKKCDYLKRCSTVDISLIRTRVNETFDINFSE